MTTYATIATPMRRCPHCGARQYTVRDGTRVTIQDKDGNRHTFHTLCVETYCQKCRHEFETRLEP